MSVVNFCGDSIAHCLYHFQVRLRRDSSGESHLRAVRRKKKDDNDCRDRNNNQFVSVQAYILSRGQRLLQVYLRMVCMAMEVEKVIRQSVM